MCERERERERVDDITGFCEINNQSSIKHKKGDKKGITKRLSTNVGITPKSMTYRDTA